MELTRDQIKALPRVPAFLLLYKQAGHWWIVDTNGRNTPERTAYTADWTLEVVLERTKRRHPFRLVCADPMPR